MRKEIKIEDFERNFELNNYKSRTNPFSMITIKVDVTNIINYCKINKNYYATVGFIIGKVVNEMDCFKYRLENGKLYKYDVLRTSYTNMTSANNIGFYSIEFDNDYKNYVSKYIDTFNSFKNNSIESSYDDHGEIWLSCEPWFSFSQLVPPFDANITIPQFIWGKFYKEEGRTYTNLMIMVHHGFADGSHIGKFISNLNNQIEHFDNLVS